MISKDDFTKALVDSVNEAFKVMLSADLAETDFSANGELSADLICTIGITGSKEGSLSIALSRQSASIIVSKMLGMEVPPDSSDINDGMGEVANVIAGGVKARASAIDNSCFQISIPTVITGGSMHIKAEGGVEKILKRFTAQNISFDVELFFKSSKTETPKEEKSIPVSNLSALEKLKAMTGKG